MATKKATKPAVQTEAPVKKTNGAVAQPETKQTNKKPLYSRPVFVQNLHINHQQAQNIFDRSFAPVARALYSIDVVLRIIGKQEKIDEVEAILQKNIQQMLDEIEKHSVLLSQLMDDNGIDNAPEYTNPKEYTVRITCPPVAQFVQLLKRMDTMLIKLDTVWLNGLIGSRERIELTLEQRNKLNGLANRLIQIEKRARTAAGAQGKGKELESVVPVEDQSVPTDSMAQAA